MWSEVTDSLLDALAADHGRRCPRPAARARGGRGHDHAHRGRARRRRGAARRPLRLTGPGARRSRSRPGNTDRQDVSAEGILAGVVLVAIVVLAIVSTRVVGRRAARTVDRVTAAPRAQRGPLPGDGPRLERHHGDRRPARSARVREPGDRAHPRPRHRAPHRHRRVRPHPSRRPRHRRARLRPHPRRVRTPTASRSGCATPTAVGASSRRWPPTCSTTRRSQGIVISARDLTDRRRAEAELREAQERFRSAFEHAPIGMALTSLDGRLFRVNRALVQILGRGESELLASSILDLTHPDDRETCRESMTPPALRRDRRAASSSSATCTTTATRSGSSVSASLVRDLNDQPLYFVRQIEDIAERRASGEALAHQAVHDPLTGLPNRAQFVERLGPRARRRGAASRARRGAVPRPRPLQGGERQPRTLGRRPTARRGRRPAERDHGPGPTWSPASAATSSRSCATT